MSGGWGHRSRVTREPDLTRKRRTGGRLTEWELSLSESYENRCY